MNGAFAPLLARIDDRLIHGQVVIGCCQPLGARRILLVDDEVAADTLQQKLYRAGVPPEVAVEFAAVDYAPARLQALAAAGEIGAVVVVVARAQVMERLRQHGARFERVQLGGAHARDGARQLVEGIFLDSADRQALLGLVRDGTEVVVQPVARSAVRALSAALLAEGDT